VRRLPSSYSSNKSELRQVIDHVALAENADYFVLKPRAIPATVDGVPGVPARPPDRREASTAFTSSKSFPKDE